MSIDLAFTDIGRGDPIVILHGLFGSKRNWGAIAKKLSAHYRVLSVDLRNHGESPWVDGMHYRDMAEDVAIFIEKHALGPCTVIGHSMGGKTAMMLALCRADLVKKLVVVDIAPVERETGFDSYIEAMAETPLAAFDTRRDIEDHLSDAVPNRMVRTFLGQNLIHEDDESGGRFRWRINLSALSDGMDEIADFPEPAGCKSFKGPSLFVAGAKSDYIQAHHMSDIERLFPKAQITHIPDAGHWLHAEAPGVFLREVTAFLNARG